MLLYKLPLNIPFACLVRGMALCPIKPILTLTYFYLQYFNGVIFCNYGVPLNPVVLLVSNEFILGLYFLWKKSNKQKKNIKTDFHVNFTMPTTNVYPMRPSFLMILIQPNTLKKAESDSMWPVLYLCAMCCSVCFQVTQIHYTDTVTFLASARVQIFINFGPRQAFPFIHAIVTL